jgi:hypothetical protein
MVRVMRYETDPHAHAWITALIDMSKAERRCTLGEFCERCGVQYRFLYEVVKGRSAISGEVLDALKKEAVRRGISEALELKALGTVLGLN